MSTSHKVIIDMQQLAGHRMCTLFAALIIRLDIHTGLNIYLSGGGESYIVYTLYTCYNDGFVCLSACACTKQHAKRKRGKEKKKGKGRKEGRRREEWLHQKVGERHATARNWLPFKNTTDRLVTRSISAHSTKIRAKKCRQTALLLFL
jgi:hypothetical protein